VGLAAGPWGTPEQVAGGSAGGKVKVNWERTIGLYRKSDSYNVQSRSWLPDATGGVLWWGPHSAPYTVYVPFFAGAASLPAATLGHPAALHKSTLFWGVRYLANVAQLKRNHMIADIDKLQRSVHQQALEAIAVVEREAGVPRTNGTIASAGDGGLELGKRLAHVSSELASEVVTKLWALTDALMFKYADGYITTVSPTGQLHVATEPYPDEWLKAVGYTKGPPPVPPPSASEAIL